MQKEEIELRNNINEKKMQIPTIASIKYITCAISKLN